jgi:hypothetical protein
VKATASALLVATGIACLGACRKVERDTPGASGSFVFAPGAMVSGGAPDAGPFVDMTDTILATETEVARSDWVLRSAVRSRGLAASFKLSEDQTVEALRSATVVKRREKSLVLDVTVRLPDASLAKDACNAVVRAYIESRMQKRVETGQARELWLRSQLDAQDAGSPVAALLRDEADKQNAESSRHENDVMVLDPCASTSVPSQH